MDTNNMVINEIKSYMDNPLKCALLLSGSWGCGKTYFVKNELKSIDNYYISLNGISSISNLSFQLLYLVGHNKFEKNKTQRKNGTNTIKQIIGTAGSILIANAEDKFHFSFKDFTKFVKNIDLQNKLIIFDDLERCELKIEEILGFINNLVEHNNFKVLIVANEEELKVKENYLKIKEKLIYQTIEYSPNIENLYGKLYKSKIKEFEENKLFVIDELKRKNHINLRTLQFIFQRYAELNKKINPILNELTTDKEILKRIYNDIFKCTVVISRDYKLGNNTLELDNLKEIFTYLLIENTYYGITGFKFVYEYVTGSIINEEKVKNILQEYIKKIKSDTCGVENSLGIINRWWESEDDDIENSTNELLNELKNNNYNFQLYPKIVVYLIRITNAGFNKNYLDNAIIFMKKNINDSKETVTLGYRILDAKLDEEELKQYKLLETELIDEIDIHNKKLNECEVNFVKEEEVGSLGKYLYDWSIQNKSKFITSKQFIKHIDSKNIIYIIEKGNSTDIRFLIYLFNEIYNYQNVSELYPNDMEDLKNLSNQIEKITIKDFSKMKKLSYGSFCKLVKEIIEKL